MSNQTVYGTGRMFCPLCGTILPIPTSSEVVTCQLCQFQQKTEGLLDVRYLEVRVTCILVHSLAKLVYEGVEEYSCRYFAVRKEKRKLSEKQQGPLVCVCTNGV